MGDKSMSGPYLAPTGFPSDWGMEPPDRVRVVAGDCSEVIKTLADNSIDSVVTDPPYALVSIAKRFGKPGSAEAKAGVYARGARGFMGKQWDTGDVAFDPAFWADVLRVLKPGGHVLAFGGTRTYHRLACAIEDAGFEIRDQIGWLYGSGFPKSHDVSKGIDRAAGAERAVIGKTRGGVVPSGGYGPDGEAGLCEVDKWHDVTAPTTAAARQWEGWGTALKPAWEPIVMARKPIKGTVAANVQEFGTGAINVDGCRVETDENLNGGAYAQEGGRQVSGSLHAGSGMNQPGKTAGRDYAQPVGRWPANLIHDGSEEVVAAFPVAPGQQRSVGPEHGAKSSVNTYGNYGPRETFEPRNDPGSAARFFYSAKADAEDRCGSKHPTVKPVDLMAYLCRLVTPPGGLVLDPFAGSGSTGMACLREGFRAILIEREAEYVADIKRRLQHVSGADTPLFTTEPML